MQVIADFHLHSKYARATSREMDIAGLSKGAKIKGLNLLGTGDFCHPKYFLEIKDKLKEIPNTGLFSYNDIYFMLTCEVGTSFVIDDKLRRIHHIIHTPSFEIVEQVNESLAKYGDLSIDGRPMLKVSAAELVEVLMNISRDIMITSAHAWTPFFSVFGSKNEFNSVEECYQEQTKHIFSLETGLSSTPNMNWRLSSLDKFTLLSNSDSHSANPWRLGREANIFELKNLFYLEIVDAIKNKDKSKFLFTVETAPEYGKYHLDGHRNCNVSLEPSETKKLNGICPRCKRKLTIGVLHRVEELADREEGFVPKNAIPFKTLLPLYEIISFVTGVNQLYSKKVIDEQNKLISRFGNEFNVLLNVSKEELLKVINEKIADAIIKVREGNISYIAGYDGVYGKPIFNGDIPKGDYLEQKSLRDFKGL